MDAKWLTASQTAARLGIKPATLYAYVSRGAIRRRRGPDGRRSYFDPADVERMARHTAHSRLAPTDIVVPTAISFLDGAGNRWYRGAGAIEIATTRRFEETAEFLWTGKWNAQTWTADPASVRAATRAHRALPRTTKPVDRLPVIVAAARRTYDDPVDAGRNLLAAIVGALGGGDDGRFAERLLRCVRLGSAGRSAPGDMQPTRVHIKGCDAVLGLEAEHGITLATIAARLAASAGADLYTAVGSALGPGLVEVRDTAPVHTRQEIEVDREIATNELVRAVARIAGWIAHAIAEYRQPTPFRPHSTYTGVVPLPEQREERTLLYAVMNYPEA